VCLKSGRLNTEKQTMNYFNSAE